MATSDAPISIGQVALTVRDLDQMTAFYEEVIGLGLVVRNGNTALLGSDRGVLLELQQDRLARPYPQEAGLFHTAFLLPSRQDLGAWLVHADKSGVRITGASHHGVSEALYLDDPEGNGIEIYRDLPRQNWTRTGDRVEMTTRSLDLKALAEAAHLWTGVPADTVIGHVHLRVGNVTQAAEFITDAFDMVQTFDLPSARWFGAGGYHHHLAVNDWQSKGAGRRTPGATGLAGIELVAAPDTFSPARFEDPWGTGFTINTARPLDV